MEKSFYIIKPEAFANRIAIQEKIISNKLKIVSLKTILLPEFIITQIYPNMSSDLYSATMKYLRCGFSELGIVEGENAISLLLEIGGKDTNPNKCEIGTIRNMFGDKVEVIYGNAVYFKNGFHRSHNYIEAVRDIELYEKC